MKKKAYLSLPPTHRPSTLVILSERSEPEDLQFPSQATSPIVSRLSCLSLKKVNLDPPPTQADNKPCLGHESSVSPSCWHSSPSHPPTRSKHQTPTPTTGTVKGHILCADTQRPARFAEVSLFHKPSPTGSSTQATTDPGTAQNLLLLNGRTLLDGSYVIDDVPPGEYYLLADLPGYIPPISHVSQADADDLDKVLQDAPKVQVVAGRTVTVDFALRHGATIKGTAQFEDGTPLRAATVFAENLAGDSVNPGLDMIRHGKDLATTDDEGSFRIFGLAPGKYRLRLDLRVADGTRLFSEGPPNARMFTQKDSKITGVNLALYPPGTLRRSKATIFEIKGDETVTGADLTVDLSSLHSITGTVLLDGDGKTSRGFAGLVDDTDGTFSRMADIEPNGSFQIDYIPEGTYTLRISTVTVKPLAPGATEILPAGKTAKVPIIVTDDDVDAGEIPLQ